MATLNKMKSCFFYTRRLGKWFVCSFVLVGMFSEYFALDTLMAKPLAQDSVAACAQWMSEHKMPTHGNAYFKKISASLGCFDGEIQKNTVVDLIEWLDESPLEGEKKILAVRSVGGDVEPAIEITERLAQSNVDVYIVDYCASSCANYFYAGTKNRHILGSALILFHGGIEDGIISQFQDPSKLKLIQHRQDDSPEQVSVSLDDIYSKYKLLQHRQNDLLQKAGASLDIIYGMARSNSYFEKNTSAFDTQIDYCIGSSEKPVTSFFFTESQAARLGILPLSGSMMTDPLEMAEYMMEKNYYEKNRYCAFRDDSVFFSNINDQNVEGGAAGK